MGPLRVHAVLGKIRAIRRCALIGRLFLFVSVPLYLRAHAHNSRFDAVHAIFKTHWQGPTPNTSRGVVPDVQISPRVDARSGQPSGRRNSKNSDRKRTRKNSAVLPDADM